MPQHINGSANLKLLFQDPDERAAERQTTSPMDVAQAGIRQTLGDKLVAWGKRLQEINAPQTLNGAKPYDNLEICRTQKERA